MTEKSPIFLWIEFWIKRILSLERFTNVYDLIRLMPERISLLRDGYDYFDSSPAYDNAERYRFYFKDPKTCKTITVDIDIDYDGNIYPSDPYYA